jgi:hypothetical protein
VDPSAGKKKLIVIGIGAAVVVGVGLALASYLGLFSDHEAEREKAARELAEYQRQLEEKQRKFEEEKRKREGGGGADAGPEVPLSTDSCEKAHERYKAERGASKPPAIDAKTEEAIKNKLSRGNYLGDCRVPGTTKVHICASILEGRAAGVTVKVTPDDPKLMRCIDEAVRRMSFPEGREMVIASTHFD